MSINRSVRLLCAVGASVCVFAGPVRSAEAAIVQVEITGTVEYNQISGGVFGVVNAGDAASISFLLDSDVFADSASFPTRGYSIDRASYDFSVGSVSVGLADPYPVAGDAPYFVIRNDDPAVDGFFLSNGLDFPSSLLLDEPGAFGNFGNRFEVAYGNEPLSSLDLLSAVGTYDFDGLTVFGFGVTDGPFDPMGLIFEQMTITVVPAPAGLACLLPLLAGTGRRRRG